MAAEGRSARSSCAPPAGITSITSTGRVTEMWIEHWNDEPKRFVWTKTAAEIITEVVRGGAVLHQVQLATDH